MKTKVKSRLQSVSAKTWAKTAISTGFVRCYRVPEGMLVLTLKPGETYELVVVPFTAGKNNPNADPGQLHWERTYLQHFGGPEGQKGAYTCASCWNEDCPVCELQGALWRQGEKELATTIRAKKRQLFIVLDLNDEKKGLQLLDLPLYEKPESLGFVLKTKFTGDEKKAKPKNYDLFASPLAGEGRALSITTGTGSMGGKTFAIITNVDFGDPREEDLDADWLDKAPCLDDLFIETSAAKLKSIFVDGIVGNETDEEEAPHASSNGKAKAAVEEEDEEEEAPKARKKAAVVEEDDEEEEEEEAPKAKKKKVVEEDEEEEEDEAPPRSSVRRPARDEDEEEEDEDEEEEEVDEDDEPPVSKVKPKPTVKKVTVVKGDVVKFLVENKWKKCEVMKVSGDGTSLTLEDDEGDTYKAIAPEDVKLIPKDTDDEDEDEAPPPKKKTIKK